MRILLWIILFVVFFLLWARYVERHNIYFPMKEILATPKEMGLFYEDVYFATDDNKLLHGWFIPGDKETFTLLFAHGNAGNIAHRLEKISFFHRLGLNVFIFDYRGYGKSQGSPSERGLYEDMNAAYGYLVKERNIPEDNIILYGESLGAAMVIDLARREKPKAMITEEAFTSVRDMAKIVYPFIPPFVISAKFDSVSKIRNISCPKLIIHSANDEIVPFCLGERLFREAKAPKKMLRLTGSHNTAFFDSEDELKGGLESFLRGLK